MFNYLEFFEFEIGELFNHIYFIGKSIEWIFLF